MKPTFLRLLLVDSLFGCALAAGAIAYHGRVHPVAAVVVGVVLAAFAAGAAVCLWLAWTKPVKDARGTVWVAVPVSKRRRLLIDVAFIRDHVPGLAIIGTGLGFLIALSGDPSRVQHRITGASSGIMATVVGVACWICLAGQHHWLTRDES